jgi:hypothetical protein
LLLHLTSPLPPKMRCVPRKIPGSRYREIGGFLQWGRRDCVSKGQ